MNISLEELYYAYLALGRLGEREGLKAAPSWWIASTLRKLRPDYDAYLERRQALFERYGERQSDPGKTGREAWAIKIGQEVAFHDEHQPLLDERISIDATTHSLEWLGADVAKSIEPDTLYRLRHFFESPGQTPPTTISLTRLEIDEAYSALSLVCLSRMREGLAWWFADLLGQVENAYKATFLERQRLLCTLCKIDGATRIFTADYREANAALGRRSIEIAVRPRSFVDLGDLIEKWPPASLAAILFAFTEPPENDGA